MYFSLYFDLEKAVLEISKRAIKLPDLAVNLSMLGLLQTKSTGILPSMIYTDFGDKIHGEFCYYILNILIVFYL